MNSFTLAIFAICCPLGIILGYTVVSGRVSNLKDTLEFETMAAIIMTVGIHYACREHTFEKGYFAFMIAVLIGAIATFNFGGLLALAVDRERKKKGEKS